MAKILVVYASDHGSTERAARKLVEGVSSVEGAEAVLKRAEEVTEDDVLGSDALVIGSPVHMGSPDWRVKKFIDEICGGLWIKNQVIGKVGAVFTTGSGFGNSGAGAELTQLALLSNLAELGMVLTPFPKEDPSYVKGGLQWGPHARAQHEDLSPGALTDERLEGMRVHGRNVARLVRALNGNNPFKD